MVDVSKTYDVYISHSASDANLATEVAKTCRANGLDAVTDAELLPGSNISDALWEALAESRALLTILPASGPTPSMAIELGSARAWNKPIFGIVTDPSHAQLPSSLSGILLYPSGRMEDIIRAIRVSGLELSDDDRSHLAKIYTELGVPVDRLALEPTRLEELVKHFSSDTGKRMSGERLLSELLRMRKQGKLIRSRSADRPRTHKGTA